MCALCVAPLSIMLFPGFGVCVPGKCVCFYKLHQFKNLHTKYIYIYICTCMFHICDSYMVFVCLHKYFNIRLDCDIASGREKKSVVGLVCRRERGTDLDLSKKKRKKFLQTET